MAALGGLAAAAAAILGRASLQKRLALLQDFRLLLLGGPRAAPKMILSSVILPLTSMAHYC